MRCGCGDCGTSRASASLTDESRLLDCLGDRNGTDLKDGLRKTRELVVQLKKDAERIFKTVCNMSWSVSTRSLSYSRCQELRLECVTCGHSENQALVRTGFRRDPGTRRARTDQDSLVFLEEV